MPRRGDTVRWRWIAKLPGLVVVGALAATACGSSDGGNTKAASKATGETTAASTEPIELGAVSSMTGPAGVLGVASSAAKAVFDEVNANGGIHGRRIDYTIGDDASTPDGASREGRKLVDEKNVVALVGGASGIECSVNATLYQQKQVYSLPGVGTATACYNSAYIAPVNTGPHLANLIELGYISETLKPKSICNIQNNNPGGNDGLEESVKQWKAVTGGDFVLSDSSLTPTSNMTPVILAVKKAGCDVAVLSVYPPAFIAGIKAADQQGVTGVTWVSGSTTFSDDVATALATTKQKIIVASEFEPYINQNADLTAFNDLMAKAKVPATAFAIGGYVAAKWMVDVLEGMEGEITRASLGKALLAKKYETSLVGTTLGFGLEDNPIGGPNRSMKMVRLEAGTWKVIDDQWVGIPEH